MEINYICTRKRKEFGKPCTFTDIGPNLLMEIDPNPSLGENFCMLPNVDREIDNLTKTCAFEANTDIFPTESKGMNHMEGGWPAAVDNTDEESMTRYRKKIEKDKSYVNTVKSLVDFVENFVMENNSIDIYEEYFEGERIKRGTDWSLKTLSIFQDFNAKCRSVVDLSWQKDSTKFAAVYSLRKTQEFTSISGLESYVWDIENNITPAYVMNPEVSMTVVEFSPINSDLILSGYVSGQVALWDIRVPGNAHHLSNVTYSHVKKVTGVQWLLSKEGTAFFSASSDGKLIAWDTRNLSSPTETILLEVDSGDIPNLDQDYTISCVEYDVTVPNTFMVGTDQGAILSFNKEFKLEEEKLSAQYSCQCGPLLALERNAFYPQLFASCDAWSLKLWSEAVIDTPVLNVVSKDGYFTDFAWSPARASTMFVTKTSGILEVWDIPGKTKEPLLDIKLDNEGVLSVDVAESGGHVICGTHSGNVQLLEVPEYLKTISELEKDLVKGCVRESETIVGGNPRSVRILGQETDSSSSVKGMDEEWWDPPDKAEDLYEEYKVLFKKFPAEGN